MIKSRNVTDVKGLNINYVICEEKFFSFIYILSFFYTLDIRDALFCEEKADLKEVNHG